MKEQPSRSTSRRQARLSRIYGRGIGLFCLAVLLPAAACGSGGGEAPPPSPTTDVERSETPDDPAPQVDPVAATPAQPGLFSDITDQAGIRFVHHNDASERRYLPETMGSGAAFFDCDGDGRADLYLVNGGSLLDQEGGPSGALYKNLGDGTFQDITRGSGLDRPFYGMGAAVGDIDNDGQPDLLVTGVGRNRLFRNLGKGRFEDISSSSGVFGGGFGSSAAFLDFDRDGYLDLFIGQYVEWSPERDIRCSPDGIHHTYCTPESYPAISSRLYRNLKGGRFQDVTESSGIGRFKGKTLGVVVLDYNLDGWPDLAVANDTVRNFLFVNQQDGRFEEVGTETGMAYSESGATRGGMGIDAADLDGDGRSDLLIGNFSQEMSALYRATERGFYMDDAAQLGLGIPTLMTLAFGTLMEDVDADGWMDVLIVNGHIEPDISRTQPSQQYAQPPQLFLNSDGSRLLPYGGKSGNPLGTPLVGRGLASADIDGDGDLDFIVTQNGRRPLLLRNNHPPRSWTRLALTGKRSNRQGIGATIRIRAEKRSWVRTLSPARSYLSACEPILSIGLGELDRIERIEILWPSGVEQTLENPPINQLLQVEEPSP